MPSPNQASRQILSVAPILLLGLLTAPSSAGTADRPYVVPHAGARDAARSAPPPSGTLAATAPCASTTALAWHGQPVPGGGTLSPGAFFNPAAVNGAGRIAFYSQVSGSVRNQGIFVADAFGLTPIAIGCGGGGGSTQAPAGCGDPSPVGGTFGGFFGGTFFAPALSEAGDVLFLADIDNGTSPRGLFLHQASTGQVVTVAAVGDPTPLGGTFAEVGPGSVDAAGVVVFLARATAATGANVFRWQAGAVTKVVAVGDAAPLGGTFSLIGTESLGFADGTSIPVGPVPAINAHGQVVFRGIVTGGPVSRGLLRWDSGALQWLVKANDPVPGGGTFLDFQGANVNDAGEVAFFSDYRPTPTTISSGWFAGSPGALRKALAFFDVMEDGAQCFGLAFSRNPMTPLDEQGNVAIWTDAKLPNGTMQERVVISSRDGETTIAARAGDPTPLGGVYGSMDAWPSLGPADRLSFGSAAPGSSTANAHFVAREVVTWLDVGFGKPGVSGVPRLAGAGATLAGAPGSLSLEDAAASAPAFLFLGLGPAFAPLLGGTLVPAPVVPPLVTTTGATGEITLAWPAWPASVPPCLEVWFQWWIADASATNGASASNGLRALTQ